MGYGIFLSKKLTKSKNKQTKNKTGMQYKDFLLQHEGNLKTLYHIKEAGQKHHILQDLLIWNVQKGKIFWNRKQITDCLGPGVLQGTFKVTTKRFKSKVTIKGFFFSWRNQKPLVSVIYCSKKPEVFFLVLFLVCWKCSTIDTMMIAQRWEYTENRWIIHLNGYMVWCVNYIPTKLF